jgi:hypothetical protein
VEQACAIHTFAVSGGPHEGVGSADADRRLREEAAAAGARRVATVPGTETTTFELDAPTPAAARELVTTIFRSVYDRSWWASVAPVAPGLAAALRECRRRGWAVSWVPGEGFRPCRPDEPGAYADLQRYAHWRAHGGAALP